MLAMNGPSDLANRTASRFSRLSGTGDSPAHNGLDAVAERVKEAAATTSAAAHDGADQVTEAAQRAADATQHAAVTVREATNRRWLAAGTALVGLLALAAAALRRGRQT
jgi:hypothetical protein